VEQILDFFVTARPEQRQHQQDLDFCGLSSSDATRLIGCH